jgi:hypothetical protein
MTSFMNDSYIYKYKGLPINDVTVVGGGGKRFCDNSTKASVIKKMRDDGGMGDQNCPKLSDVIYGRPLRINIQLGFILEKVENHCI